MRAARGRHAPRHALAPKKRGTFETYVVLLLLLLTSGFVAGTTAAFVATTNNANNTYGLAGLGNPNNLIGQMAGTTNIALSWDQATNASGYRLDYADANWGSATTGTAPTCPTAASASWVNGVQTTVGLASVSVSDPAMTRTAAAQGRWFCYRTKATAGPWTNQVGNNAAAFKLGYSVVSVAITNPGAGNTVNVPQANDAIAITYNQYINKTVAGTPVAGTHNVCFDGADTNPAGAPPNVAATERVFLATPGTEASGCYNETPLVGYLHWTGMLWTADDRWNAGYAWTNCNPLNANLCKTLTITLTTRIAGANTTQSPTTAIFRLWPNGTAGNMPESTNSSAPCAADPADTAADADTDPDGRCIIQATGKF